jgi:acetate kinase
MAALKGGRSIDTTMGLTPLEGLVMGTRSGDLDPSIVFFLVNRRGYDIDKVERLLNKESGILGVSGLTNDVKTVLEASRKGNEPAKLALDIFSYRVKKYIGAYMAALGGLDCLVFTAGIGERSAEVRKMICAGLKDIGIQLDHELNKRCFSSEMVVSSEESRVKIVVVPTDEEHVIASETYRIASKKKG